MAPSQAAAQQQARLITGVSYLMMCLVPLFAVVSTVWLGAPRTGLAVAALGSGMAMGPFVQRSVGAGPAGHVLSGSLYLTITCAALLNGGFASGLAYPLTIVPLLAHAAAGARAGRGWAAVVIATVGALYAARALGVVLPSELGPEQLDTFAALAAVCMPVIVVVTLSLLRDTLQSVTRHLDAERATLDAVFEHAPEGLLLHHRDGTVRRTNEAARVLLGVAPEGSRPEDDAWLGTPPVPCPGDAERALLRPDGRRRRVRIIRLPLGDHGQLTLLQDLTRQHEAAQAMQNARDRAVEANRSKATFLANMSHELRTPLNAVLGYGELVADELDEQGDPAEISGDVDHILTAGRHLLALIDDVLDLARMEAGDLVLHGQPVPVRRALDAVCGGVAPLFDDDGHPILCVDDAVDYVLADEVRLRQVLVELVHNAVTHGGTRAVRIVVEPSPDGQWVYLVVDDDGRGMPPDTLARALEPFEQGDASSTRQIGGSGLGLPLVARLVEGMGGSFELVSQPERGTRATVRLPSARSPATPPRRVSVPPA
jgi:signal transduction histidine kinase